MIKHCLIGLGLILSLHASAGTPADVNKHEDILWEPENKLTLDIYTPTQGEGPHPVVVIYHGGGWLINDNSIMDSMSEYLAREGEFVVANMNYRLLGDNNNTTTINQIVEDALGGLLWVKEHIADYGGDPERIAVTGDSAGGHLSSMVLLAGPHLGSEGFSGESLTFTPSYLPEGKTAGQVAAEDGLRVQAAVISYGAFDMLAAARGGFEKPDNFFWQMGGAEARGLFGDGINAEDHPEYYRAVSPLYLIPEADTHPLPPQFFHVGSRDQTTPPEAVKAYVDALEAKGHPTSYTLYPDLNHAYLDTGCNEFLGSCFDTHAIEPLEDIVEFLNRHLR